jgi:predicted RND superfamily exporter protein
VGLLEAWVRGGPRRICGAFAVAFVLAACAATSVRVDSSIQSLLLTGDPLRALDEIAKAEFGSDEIILIGLDLGRRFDDRDLIKLSSISERVAAIPGVERVRDLSTTEDIRADVDGGLDGSRLLKIDELPSRLEAIRARVKDHRLYRRTLVSEDQRVFGILVYVDRANRGHEALHDVTEAVIRLVEDLAPPWHVYAGGYPVVAHEADRIVKRDLALLTPVTLLATSAVLFYLTHSLVPMTLLLIQFAWVEAVALGWLALTGVALNVVVSGLPTILMAVTSTYVLYFVALLRKVEDDEDPGAKLVELLYVPVLLSGVSTALGFLSLYWMGIEAIRDLGIGLAVGITAGTASTLLLLPAIVQVLRPRVRLRHIAMLERVALVGVRMARHPWLVIGSTVALLVVVGPGALRLSVHTDTLGYFKDDNAIRVAANFFRDRLGGGFLFDVVVRGDRAGRALDPDVLGFLDRVKTELEAYPATTRTISMLDYFYLMDAAMRHEDVALAVPTSRETAAQYVLAYEAEGDPEDFGGYLSYDRSALRLLANVHGGTKEFMDLASRVESLKADRPAGASVDTLGSAFLYSRAMEQLTHGMLSGLLSAGVTIGVLMLLGLRSIRLAIVAAIPNVTPILLCGGAAGWLGIPLSMGTSLVGCVTLGLAVDDTTHVLGHLHRRRSLEDLYRFVGPGVVLTTVCLSVGFSTLMLSEFQTIQAMGAATSVTMLIAVAGDLILLPSMLVVAGYRRFESDIESPGTGELRLARAERRAAA